MSFYLHTGGEKIKEEKGSFHSHFHLKFILIYIVNVIIDDFTWMRITCRLLKETESD